MVFVLFFLGFGVKAGIVPLHIWLPDAHPVAPSNISALMSGIVIKSGIYGMARVFFDFYGPPPLWTGAVVLAAGVVSALVGVLYALQEHDLKRLLAYHSIENIGIILMGFGAALMFRALNYPVLAAVAIVSGLYHTLNHATFKGLLFLAAGSVVQSTKTRNMEEMGGLIRRMPSTALFFLIGAVAISGLPPLNGFVSEWLTYQVLLAGFGTTPSLTRLMFPIAGSLLALTAALAAACFVKAFGIPFLALPRSEAAAAAQEVSLTMQAGMGDPRRRVLRARPGRLVDHSRIRSDHRNGGRCPARRVAGGAWHRAAGGHGAQRIRVDGRNRDRLPCAGRHGGLSGHAENAHRAVTPSDLPGTADCPG